MASPNANEKAALDYKMPVIVFALALLVGVPTLFNDFAWDDTYLVLQNSAIHDLTTAWELFTKPWASGVAYALGETQNQAYYRPLALLSMAIDWALSGPNPIFFHATNILIHAFAALFLALWLSRLFPEQPKVPLIVSLLWAVHPVHTEAIALVSYRTTLLSGLFTFAGLYLLSPSAGVGRTILGLLSFCLALLSKETALIFPALLFLSDFFFCRPQAALRQKVVSQYVPLLFVSLLYWVLRVTITGPGVYDWFAGLSAWQKALIGPRIFFLYVRLTFIPYPLCPFYDWDVLGVPKSPFEPDILSGAVLFIITIFTIVLFVRRKSAVAFGLSFFLVGLLPFSHIVPFFDAAGERFLYVPLPGILLATVLLLLLALGKLKVPSGKLKIFLATAAIASFSTLTLWRLKEWKDSETILRAVRRDFPHSTSANLGLGRLLLGENRYAEAIQVLKEVVARSPKLGVGYGLLAAAQALSGDVRGAKDTLWRAPLPEPNLPSAAQIARKELMERKAFDVLKEVGLALW